MFKFLAVIAAAVASASAYSMAEYDMLFTGYKSAFGVTFTAEEEAMRRAVFQVNVDKIAAHNAAGHSWDMSINEFAHMTPAEFAAGRIGGYVPKTLRGKRNEASLNSVSIPSSVDWAKEGKVTAVKNQGQCGSCWAFSTTGSTESINAINGNALTSLSEQQLMDCSTSYGNQGCNGGLMDNAFKYIIANGGLCSEASYPYTAHDGTCKQDCTKVVSIKSYTDVPTNDASQFKAAIAQQPVSIAIEADQTSFQFYSGGVLTKTCGSNLDHGVLAVGYGTMSGQGYYKVKNSWGASWGMSGYVLLSDDSSLNGGAGQCGILSDPSWPSQ